MFSYSVLRSPVHPRWSLQCDRCKSIDIEVSIAIDTFTAKYRYWYRRYFYSRYRYRISAILLENIDNNPDDDDTDDDDGDDDDVTDVLYSVFKFCVQRKKSSAA